MEIGLNLFSVRNLIGTENDFLDTAKKLKKMGYEFMQYSGAQFDAERIRRVSETSDMPIFLTHVPMDRIISDTEKLMDEHNSFGCKNIGLGMMPLEIIEDEKVCKNKIDELNRAGERMKKGGFTFFYHHHFFEFYRHNGQTVFDYMIENAPFIHYTVDTYWLQYGGVDICDFIKKLDGRMECVHLKDYAITAEKNDDGSVSMKPIFAPVGDGTINFEKFVKTAKELDARYFFVEQDNAADLPDTLAQVEKSVRYIRDNL